MDTFFLLLIIGGLRWVCAIRAQPDPVQRSATEKIHDNREYRLGYWLPMSMMVARFTGLMLEGTRINATHPAIYRMGYIGSTVGGMEGRWGPG